MTDIKRYDVHIGWEIDYAYKYEEIDEEGTYVHYDDHLAALTRVEEARDKAIVLAVGRMSAETFYTLCQEIEDLKKENAALLLRIEEMQH